MSSVVEDNPPTIHLPLQKYATSEEVAYMIIWLLGPESIHSMGELFCVDSGHFA